MPFGCAGFANLRPHLRATAGKPISSVCSFIWGAYWLLHELRGAAPKRSIWRTATFETIRSAFLKIAVRIEELKTRIKMALPSAHARSSLDRARHLNRRPRSMSRCGKCRFAHNFNHQRVATVPQHPPPSTRLMPCARIAKRLLPRIIGARGPGSHRHNRSITHATFASEPPAAA
jgi:hypothetical protein